VPFDPEAIRRQFAFFGSPKPPIYLDSAATTQKPAVVLDAVRRFYETENGSAYRGLHPLAEAATARWEEARATVGEFLNAPSPAWIVFTKSATESLNLLARSLGTGWKRGDAVVASALEHHSNLVPWFQLKESAGIDVRVLPCDDEGALDLAALDGFLADGRVKLVAVTAQSNVLGVRPDLPAIIAKAKAAGALTCVDAAQAVSHGPIDVAALGCDFLVFSGHKAFAPTGVGVLCARPDLLAAMPPFLGGGGMVRDVSEEGFVPADVPERFEAGTLPIGEAVGLMAALRWMRALPRGEVGAHERTLLEDALALGEIPGARLLGPRDSSKRHGCLSFTIDGLHAHDLADQLAARGFCLRSGHHCAEPLHRRLGLAAYTLLSV
jgi:cysteine desulfurase/selenocysteine lyase